MLFTCPAVKPYKRLIILSCICFHRFASSRSGYILEIDYSRVVIRNIRRLMPAEQQANCREKCTTKTGVFGIRGFINKFHFKRDFGKHKKIP